MQWFARFQRLASSAETAAALLEQVYRNDVRDRLALVKAPTLVVHRREDRAIPYRLGREVAAGVRGAMLVPLEGSAHFPWAGDANSVVRALCAVLAVESQRGRPAGEPAAVLLSRREREVLKLVANGLSDREIAEQLIVSPHRCTATWRTSVTSSAADRGRRQSPKRLAWVCSEPKLRRPSHPSPLVGDVP